MALVFAFALLLTASAPERPTPTPDSAPHMLALDAGTSTGRLGRVLAHDLGRATSPNGGNTSTPSIETVLTPEGRIAPDAKGNFSADGFVLDARPGVAPRFVRAGADGAYSGAFRTNVPNDFVLAVAMLSPTEFVVGGRFTDLGGNPAADYVARWNGSAWQALGGGTSGSVLALAVSGSDVYVGGWFTTTYDDLGQTNPIAGTSRIARWNGSAWQALGGGTQGEVAALAVSGSDVYVGGFFDEAYQDIAQTQAAPGTRNVARWSGSAWQALGGGVSGGASALAVSGSDIYVGGMFTTAYAGPGQTNPVADTRNVARWNGSAWQSLGGGTNDGAFGGSVYALAVNGSDIYVGGVFTTAYAGPGRTSPIAGTSRIARWNGSAWSAIGGGVNNDVHALMVSGSDVYVGGEFTTSYTGPGQTNPVATASVARWNGSAWQALGRGGDREVYALAVSGSDVYAGGEFLGAYNGPGWTNSVAGTKYLARWDGSVWSSAVPPGSGPNSSVFAIVVLSPTEFIVGGYFTDLGGNPAADYVARWNGSAWQALGGGVTDLVYTIAVNGSDVYVGGRFQMAYADPGQTSPVAGTSNVARWNGSAWQPLGGGTSGTVSALAVSGSDVYVGGQFTTAYTDPGQTNPVADTRFVARWNGSAWQALGGGVAGSVHTIAVSGSDVYVGGNFETAYAGLDRTNPVADTRNVARWNGSAWQALGGGVADGVYAIAVSGSDVYVGGVFREAYHDPDQTNPITGTSRIARWNGSAWQALGGGADSGPNGSVNALAVSGSDVYVAGRFITAYTDPSQMNAVAGTSHIARWNGSAWQALGGGVNNTVRALAIGQAPPASPTATFPTGAPVKALFLGGDFTATSNGTPAANLTYYTEGTNLSVGVAEAPTGPRDLALTVLSNATAAPRLRINAGGAAQQVTVEVFDMLGRRLSSERMGVLGRRELAVGAALAPGVYIVKVSAVTGTVTTTVVVH